MWPSSDQPQRSVSPPLFCIPSSSKSQNLIKDFPDFFFRIFPEINGFVRIWKSYISSLTVIDFKWSLASILDWYQWICCLISIKVPQTLWVWCFSFQRHRPRLPGVVLLYIAVLRSAVMISSLPGVRVSLKGTPEIYLPFKRLHQHPETLYPISKGISPAALQINVLQASFWQRGPWKSFCAVLL